MDTITHALLGASVGEALLGKKLGNKAPVWGAIAANIPDLDLVASLFVNQIEALSLHRGPTHSLVFCCVLAPILGYFLHKRFGKASFQHWSGLICLGMISHVLLDCCNSMGVQLFYPFYSEPIAWGNIFYVDPIYTALLAIGIIPAIRIMKGHASRRILNSVGLFLSSLYMIFTFTNQAVADAVFTNALHLQGKSVQRKLTLPTPFNTFIWYTIAEEPTGYNLGYYHIFDDSYDVSFQFLPRNPKLDTLISTPQYLSSIEEITQGYYLLETEGDTLHYRDLRSGINYPYMGIQATPQYFVSYSYPYSEDIPHVTVLNPREVWRAFPIIGSNVFSGSLGPSP